MSALRLVTIIIALVLAMTSAIIFLPIAALVDPVTRTASANLTAAALEAVVSSALNDPAPGLTFAMIGHGIRAVAAIICAVPIIVIGLIGEAAKVASWLWYSVATGLVTAAVPFVLRLHTGASANRLASAVEIRFALAFFLTGIVSGLAYWLVAGRSAQKHLGTRT
jgi:hypothetical protein